MGKADRRVPADVGGAMVFSQEAIKRMFEDHGEKTLAEGAEKKGTLIFTGTLVSLSLSIAMLEQSANDHSGRSAMQC